MLSDARRLGPAIVLGSMLVFGSPALGDGLPNGIPNARRPLPWLLTGGQPEARALRALSESGVRTVIDLRGPDEDGVAGARERVESLGMRYVSIPITGSESLDAANAAALGEWLEDPTRRPILLHCRSGERVGALYALYRGWVAGDGPAAALAAGESAGLDRMRETVSRLLASPPEPDAQAR